MLRPPPLLPGSTIAVVAPASAPRDLERYRTGLARLRAAYDVRTAWAPGSQRGYLSAPDPVRTAALHDAIRNPAVQGIVCVRGGYGCLRLLDRLDWALARQHPTLLVGYSDVTALHLAFYARAGWTGVSGPVVTEWATADDETLADFRNLAQGATSTLGTEDLSPLHAGDATGPLLGGNLSVLTHLLGTPYTPDWTGAILVLEDVGEAPYRIDRMLNHLDQTGILDAVAGVVIGDLNPGDLSSHRPTLSVKRVIADYFENRPYPVATDLPYGHRMPRCSLPIGSPVRLVVRKNDARLQIQSPVVQP